jgi:hypothetical protein
VICYRGLKFPQIAVVLLPLESELKCYGVLSENYVCCPFVFCDTVIKCAVCPDVLLKCLWLQLAEDVYRYVIRFQQDRAASSVT